MTEFGNELTAYEGNEPYIFISYAHKDSDRVLPILARMQKEGYRLWFDRGIEAGTEWPEYIEEHLIASECVLVFLSASAIDSQNCRNEINLALDEEKKMLAIYLEETELRRGMRLQLGSVQSLFAYRHPNDESFLRELCGAKILEGCKGNDPAEGLEFRLTYDGAGYAVQNCTIQKGEKLVIPDTYEGLPVTYVDHRAFGRFVSLREIVLPNNLRGIDRLAFYGCLELTGITIPKQVSEIAGNAFRGCSSLRRFDVVPENETYTSVDGVLFSRDGKRLIAYPAGREAEVYTVPQGVTEIADRAFSGCKSLRHIVLPEQLRVIGPGAFASCSRLREMDLPDGVTEIGEGAFRACEFLREITLPRGVRKIEAGTFSHCRKLRRVRLSAGIAEVDPRDFNGCPRLSEILVDSDNPHFTSIDGNLYSKDGETLVAYAVGRDEPDERVNQPLRGAGKRSFLVPDTVKLIGDGAFYGARLHEVRLGNAVTEIGEEAFFGMRMLVRVVLPKGLLRIERSAFASCISLADLNFLGTVAEWAKIRKARDWCYRVPIAVIHCSDGDAPI